LSFKKSLNFLNLYIKSASKEKLYLCRIDLLFRQFIVPNIQKRELDVLSKKKISLRVYTVYFLLALYSFINILRLRCSRIKIAHYLIDIKNSDDFYDFRSKEILDIVNPNKSVNFILKQYIMS
jgi:hypothetical protein